MLNFAPADRVNVIREVQEKNTNLLKFLFDFGGPDDERAPNGVLHGLDAWVHVVDGEAPVVGASSLGRSHPDAD